MLLLVFFSFLAGLATILAPCIWPLLPIVLSSSFNSSKGKSLGIALGVVISFSFFTLFLSYLVKIFHFDPNIFRVFSVVVIFLLGLSLLIPFISGVLESAISRMGGLLGSNRVSKPGFGGGLLTGLSLGVIWSPCAGPILASIVALTTLGNITGQVVLITLSYALGTGIPLFFFALGSQALLARVKGLSSLTGSIQKVFGIIMILTAIAIYTNFDKVVSAKLLNLFPSFGNLSTSFETNVNVTNELSSINSKSTSTLTNAPDFVGITKWLNTDKPLNISDLKGKVVLVDFWTYTCINCIRTLPYVTSWYDKYSKFGFVVVGVHTPEFEFEKDTGNVLSAIKQFNIHYPVAQDNNYSTWNNYSNQYWPAEYLIDSQGKIRETHFGEGNYDETEKNIQSLLKEEGKNISLDTLNLTDQTPHGDISPESYIGSDKAQFYYPNGGLGNGSQSFSLNQSIPVNSFSLGGIWTEFSDQATSSQYSVLEYNFLADKVFLVLRPSTDGSVGKIKVLIDSNLADQSNAGSDVVNGTVTVSEDKLYNLVDLKGRTGNHLLRLEFQTPGVRVYAFTFG